MGGISTRYVLTTLAAGVALGLLIVFAAWVKFGAEGSDYQRLHRLEHRVSQLEAER